MNDMRGLFEYVSAADIKTAVFDFDGTMVYTEDFHWMYYYKLLEEALGIDYPYPLHANTTGMRYDQAMDWLSNYYGFDVSDVRIAEYRASHPHRISGDLEDTGRNPYSYFPEFVRLFHSKGTRLCVLSANDVFTIADCLHTWELDEMFSTLRSVVPMSENKADALGELVGNAPAIVFDDAVQVLNSYGRYENVIRVAIKHPFSKGKFDEDPDTYDFAIDVSSECDVITAAKKYL